MRTRTTLLYVLLLAVMPVRAGPSDSVVDPEQLLGNLDAYLGDTVVVTAKIVGLSVCTNCLSPPYNCCNLCLYQFILERTRASDSTVFVATTDTLGNWARATCFWNTCEQLVCDPFTRDSTYTVRGYLTLAQRYTFVVMEILDGPASVSHISTVRELLSYPSSLRLRTHDLTGRVLHCSGSAAHPSPAIHASAVYVTAPGRHHRATLVLR